MEDGTGYLRWTGIAPCAGVALGVVLLLLGGCASAMNAGAPLATTSTDAAVHDLAVRARAGDKQAQFELGMRFETGDGVEKNREQAIALYRQAANSSGGILWVWSPPVGNAPGRTIPINQGPVVPGLPEARQRLEGMGVL